MPQTAPLLCVADLSFHYPALCAPPLLEGLSFDLHPGVSWLVGDEGTGKTTLLQLLAGELAGKGELRVGDMRLADNRLAYRQRVAWFAPRDTRLDEQTARQVFEGLKDRHPTCDLDALALHIDGLSLTPHLDKTLTMMSTGTRRKVLMAAALAAACPVTLLDQPFMALDRPSIDYLLGVLGDATRAPDRAWLVADYEAPTSLALSATLQL